MKLNGWWRLYIVYVVVAALSGMGWGLIDRGREVQAGLSLHDLSVRIACMNVGPGGASDRVEQRNALDDPLYVMTDGDTVSLEELSKAVSALGDKTPANYRNAFLKLNAATARCTRERGMPPIIATFWPAFLINAIFVWLALSLPVLIIGLVVRWVARGFKRTTQ